MSYVSDVKDALPVLKSSDSWDREIGHYVSPMGAYDPPSTQILIPTYKQMALLLVNLHNRTGRRDTQPAVWKESRCYFYWAVRAHVARSAALRDLTEGSPGSTLEYRSRLLDTLVEIGDRRRYYGTWPTGWKCWILPRPSLNYALIISYTVFQGGLQGDNEQLDASRG
ncbi:hypothetical protein BDZ89DRAFT_1223063 [Hymenopellis radicata]|nr:hypothetical protein BDZ89DRAFT_1223063 [Hymenopellis radicata]